MARSRRASICLVSQGYSLDLLGQPSLDIPDLRAQPHLALANMALGGKLADPREAGLEGVEGLGDQTCTGLVVGGFGDLLVETPRGAHGTDVVCHRRSHAVGRRHDFNGAAHTGQHQGHSRAAVQVGRNLHVLPHEGRLRFELLEPRALGRLQIRKQGLASRQSGFGVVVSALNEVRSGACPF
jgi:hypothetical protein